MLKILIVDDEEDIRDFLREELESPERLIRTASTGEEAFELIDDKQWDLAFIDLKLATGVSGLDVIDVLKRKCPTVTVAAITGYVDIAMKQKAEKLGIKAFLMKPDDIQPDVLAEKMREWFK